MIMIASTNVCIEFEMCFITPQKNKYVRTHMYACAMRAAMRVEAP